MWVKTSTLVVGPRPPWGHRAKERVPSGTIEGPRAASRDKTVCALAHIRSIRWSWSRSRRVASCRAFFSPRVREAMPWSLIFWRI